MKLEGKVAVVTGAGRGLGRAIALALAREGAGVCIVSRTWSELKAVAGQIEEKEAECLPLEGDISRQDFIMDMVQHIETRFSTIDILVNNASIIGPARFFEDTDFESWQQTININLNGVFYGTRMVLPLMAHKNRGKIINIASGLGQMPFPRFSAYSAGKAGVIQLTRSLSEELKDKNIQINAVDPGVMDTPLQEEIRALGPDVLGESLYQRFMEFKKNDQLKDPDDVAGLVVFLASPESDHLTGTIGTLKDYADLGWQERRMKKGD